MSNAFDIGLTKHKFITDYKSKKRYIKSEDLNLFCLISNYSVKITFFGGGDGNGDSKIIIPNSAYYFDNSYVHLIYFDKNNICRNYANLTIIPNSVKHGINYKNKKIITILKLRTLFSEKIIFNNIFIHTFNGINEKIKNFYLIENFISLDFEITTDFRYEISRKHVHIKYIYLLKNIKTIGVEICTNIYVIRHSNGYQNSQLILQRNIKKINLNLHIDNINTNLKNCYVYFLNLNLMFLDKKDTNVNLIFAKHVYTFMIHYCRHKINKIQYLYISNLHIITNSYCIFESNKYYDKLNKYHNIKTNKKLSIK